MKVIRPRVYFDVEVGGLPIGRIILELFSDANCPKTIENFCVLSNKHYKGTVFHRVVKNFMIQGGDWQNGNGSGGESIFGGTFEDEDFTYKHDKPFLLSMANKGKNTNGSQFFITTQPAPHLDNIHVVFGQVVSGQDVVSHIENLPVDRMSRPLQDAKIVSCGELVLKSQLKEKKKKDKKKKKKSQHSSSSSSSSSSESSSESDSEKSKKKKSKKKKWSETKEDKAPESKKIKPDETPHPLVSITKIDPDEIPKIPENKYLFRRDAPINQNNNYKPFFNKNRRPNYHRKSPGGRIFKGRGVCRYRSLSRSRSRSITPPHWKREQKKIIKYPEFQKILQKQQSDPDDDSEREDWNFGNLKSQIDQKSVESNHQKREDEKENTPKRRETSNDSDDTHQKSSKYGSLDDKYKSSGTSRHNDRHKSSSRHDSYSDRYKSNHKSRRSSSERNDDKSQSRYKSPRHRHHQKSSRRRFSPRRSSSHRRSR